MTNTWLILYPGVLQRSQGRTSLKDSLILCVLSPGGYCQLKRLTRSTQNLVKDNDYFKGSGKSFGFRIDPSRVIAETHATDSYQNILFSLLQFRLLTGTYPKDVTVVTHQFKEARFMNCHFQALGLAPRGELKRGGRLYGAGVIGVDPPEHITSQESLKQGEALRGIGLWRRDLYGTGPELADKRRKRGWVSGMEEDLFLNKGLEEVVEQLVCWKGGEGNEWFPRMEELPWYQDFIGS